MGAKKVKSLEAQFPAILFVRKEEDGGIEYFPAFATDAEAVEDDAENPTIIAVYRLDAAYRAKKIVEYLN